MTTTATATLPPTPSRENSNPHQQQQQPIPQKLEPFNKLALARLQHHVNELQLQVDDHGHSLSQKRDPRRKIFHCIVDATALTAGIGELKRLVGERNGAKEGGGKPAPPSVRMIVPLGTLDELDKLKKGTDTPAINARETIRFLDRSQTHSSTTNQGRSRRRSSDHSSSAVRIQQSSDRYATWVSVPVPDKRAGLPELQGEEEPPLWVKDIVNCVVYYTREIMGQTELGEQGEEEDEVILLTDDEALALWAREFGIRVAATEDLSVMVRREDLEFQERKRQFEFRQRTNNITVSPRGGRGGARGGRGGQLPIGLGRRNTAGETTYKEEIPKGVMDPNGFGRGGHIRVVDGPVQQGIGNLARVNSVPLNNRGRQDMGGFGGGRMQGGQRGGGGVARGKGRLWEP